MVDEQKFLDYLKRTAADLRQARRRLREAEAREHEPVAIVGMGCRLPGGVSSPEGLWDLLVSRTDAVSGFPADRGWELGDSAEVSEEESYARQGGFVADVAGFDAAFFGISPREALAMDPQQRLLLEVSWEALERAGIDPAGLRGSRTGVFAGAAYSGYGTGLGGGGGSEGYQLTGVSTSVVSGRVSYGLGLEGPAVTVDTACSSSLVALHLACQALRSGECDLALAGGVTVMVNPGMFAEFSRQGGLAADGRCKSFGAGADGTGWAEGAGIVVVERLSDARRRGHTVLAVVRGSAVNQDGASNGLTAPNGPSQQRVIRAALASAQVATDDVDVVEAHGTGTVLGDPIEAQALLATYGQGRPEGQPLWLGSVKSNIGHAQSAAGVAGIMKTVLALQHGMLPATLHAAEPSPHVDWSAGAVRLLTEPVPWPADGRPRRAGVSAFGVSGTNAHVIMEEAPSGAASADAGEDDGDADATETQDPRTPVLTSPDAVAWLVSARSAEALAAQAGRLREFLAACPDLDPADVAWSLAATRSVFGHRAVITGPDPLQGLAAVAAGQPGAGVVTGAAAAVGKTVFVFPGQGGQWAGMGRELAVSSPVFAARLAECGRALARYVDWDLDEVLAGELGLDRADVVQPALWAVMVALAAAWQAAGVTPDAVAGHSQGEIAAAVVAGILSVEDGARVVALRSRALTALAGHGAMASVAAPAARVRELIGDLPGLGVAAVNGPAATVVSGDPESVDMLVQACAAEGIRAKVLPVDYASHGPQVESLRDEILELLAPVVPGQARVPMVSAMTGELVAGPELGAGYWYESLRAPVRFADAVQVLAGSGHGVFVEVSPHPVLTGAVAETADGTVVAGTLRRDDGGADRFAASLGEVFTRGVPVDWTAVLSEGRQVELPTYAFQRHRFWPRADGGGVDVRGTGLAATGHPLAGVAIELADGGVVLTGRLSTGSQPWLADHVVGGAALFPGTGFVELAAQAGDAAGCPVVDELMVEAPLVLPASGGVQVQVVAGPPAEDGRRTVEVHARAEGAQAWRRHASGVLAAVAAVEEDTADLAVWPPVAAVPVDAGEVYAGLAAGGYGYGPAFRGLRGVWCRDGEVFVEVALPEVAGGAAGFGVHPALLDAVLHASGLVGGGSDAEGVMLPFAWTGVRVAAGGAAVLRARLGRAADGGLSVLAADEAGGLVVSVGSLILRPAPAGELSGAGAEDGLFGVEWVKIPAGAAPGPKTWAVVGADRWGLAEALAEVGEAVRAYPDLGALAGAADETPPQAVAVCADETAGGVLGAVTGALDLVQEWLSLDGQDARLVMVTRGAVGAANASVTDVAAAGIWGLLRSVQSEEPGRITLADLPVDGPRAGTGDVRALAAAVAGGEPELAVRDGVVFGRRLVRADRGEAPAPPRPAGTVLVTGGTGLLGGLVARHLAATGRAEAVLLASRSGPAAAGVPALAAGIAEEGSAVQVDTCDVAAREELAGILARVPAEHPLTGVVHAAGVIDDATVGTLTAERAAPVLTAKAAGAWHLHELTAAADLEFFVLFSSAAATFGSAGQGSYAAANAYLDGLAEYRRARELPGTSIAWGLWEQASAMTGHLSEGQLTRVSQGTAPLSSAEGLALLDAALGHDEPLLVAAKLNTAALAQAGPEQVPPLLRSLAGGHARRASATGATAASGAIPLVRQLAGLPEDRKEQVLTGLVRAHAAAVLGHPSAGAVEAGQAFKDLGFDSLTAIELRNWLSDATGLRLPATLVFDYPTPLILARFLRGQLLGEQDKQPVVPAAAMVAGDPVVIVGMGCRFPGGAADPDVLWDLLAAGTDAISGFPADRGWELGTEGYARQGGFVADAARFDAGFFGISPREALAMDPQQRLLLEVSWEALERAGIPPATLRGSRTGVFAGGAYSGYGVGLGGDGGTEGYQLTGISTSVISGRVAYALGFEGPAVTVDTACSSALVALHWACQALRSGECDLALAGGVTIMVNQGVFAEFSRQGGLAADARCKAFSAAADGTAWAEGAGMVVVERLSDARRRGHPVLAVVRGSAVNQDGASNGLTAPNGPSQQRVIRAALASAGLSPADVDAVEAHGTGTVLGDPIEAQALIAAYGQDRLEDRPLWLGSVKSNIGHTQAAAGAAGIIKVVQALRHGLLPATLHVAEPSREVDWDAGAVRLLAEPVPWQPGDHPRRAGVSSFGISGTNAHVIIEEAPAGDTAPETPAPETPAPAPVLAAPAVETEPPLAWLVSGRSAQALSAQAGRLSEWLAAWPDLDPADVAWSLARTRSAFTHRAVITGRDRGELTAGLAAVTAGQPNPCVTTGTAAGETKAGFLFSGQGAQRAGMAAGLHQASPVFAEVFDRACALLGAQLGEPVADVALGRAGAERANETLFAQTGLFAVQAGLVAVLAKAGVTPDAVAGHSVGEVAAAYAAGVLSLEDACALVAARARLMQALPGGGAMCAIAAPEAEILAALAGVDGVSVAAVNGPAAVVISGDAETVSRVAAGFAARGMRTRELRVSHAFHSARMDPILGELAEAAAVLDYRSPQVPWVSTLTGELVQECGPGYWVRQAREAVRFADAVAVMAAQGIGSFLEIGPDGTLSALGPAAQPDTDAAFVPTQRPETDAAQALLTALAQIHTHGVPVDWTAVLPAGEQVELPTYAFRHQRYWPGARPVALAGGDGTSSEAEARFWAAVEGGDVGALTEALAVDGQRSLTEVLPALAAWRRRERDRSVTAGWRYRAGWVPAPGGTAGRALTGRWVLVVPPDAGTAAQWCAAALAAAGAEVTLAQVPAGARRADVAAQVTGLGGDLAGVVSLLAAATDPVPGYPAVPAGLAGTLALVQGLGDADISAPLWVLTQGAAAGPGEELASPVQAQVWGFGRVAALECPERWGGLVDLPPVLDEAAGAGLAQVLAGCGEDQVAIRPAGILVRRLARVPEPREQGFWAPRGTVLVTGGTGAIGGHVARWAAERGAPRLVLASRSGAATAGAAPAAAGLAETGTAVEVIACDTATRGQLTGLLARIGAGGPPLTAVMHTAGARQTTAIEDVTLAEMAGVAAAKAGGAALLDELTSDLDLDAFVLFSSISSTWGSGMQPGYAAANAFLDALAEHRRSRGRPATSVAWGLWDGGGITSGDDAVQLQRRGLRAMDPALAIRALSQAVDAGEGPVTVADVDWARFVPSFTLRRPSHLLRDLPEASQALASAAQDSAPATDAGALAERLAGLSRAEQDRALTDLVRAESAAVLGHSSPEAVEAGRAFSELGFDSLTAVELRNRLGAVTGLKLPATLIFDYASPAALAGYLRTKTLKQEKDSLPAMEELDRLASMLSALARDGEERRRVAARLEAIVHDFRDAALDDVTDDHQLDEATDDEMFSLVEKELGIDEFD